MRVLPRSVMKSRQWARLGWAMGFAIAGLMVGLDRPAGAEASADGASALDRRWIPSASFYTMGNVDQRSAQMSADTRVKQGDTLLDKDG